MDGPKAVRQIAVYEIMIIHMDTQMRIHGQPVGGDDL